MDTNKRSVAVGVFEDRMKAQQAVNELRRMGFSENEIGVAARNGEAVEGANDVNEGSHAGTGAAAGLATGAGVGALWGLGIVAGVLPVIGPAIAGGTLAAILSSAAAGAAVAGIAGALIGLGIPDEEAEYYESEFKSGRTVVTVKAGDRYDEVTSLLRRHGAYNMSDRTASTGTTTRASMGSSAATGTGNHSSMGSSATHAEGDRIQVKEEELRAEKTPVKTGEVHVHKEVHTEHKSIDVPVRKEEVVVERHPVSGHKSADTDIRSGDDIRVPVMEEQVQIEKVPVVKEEIEISKKQTRDTKHLSDNIRKEDVHVETRGNVKETRE